INIFIFVVFSNNTLWQIKEEIKDGTIAMAFIKPISYRARFIFTNLGNIFMQFMLIGLPCFSIAYLIFICIGYIHIASIWIFILHLILFILALFCAALLNDAINYIFGVLCFYTSSGWGINQIKDVIIGFFAGTLLPLSFFPGIFGEIIQYFPFAGMAQNPVLILLMKVDPIESLKLIGLNCIWLILLECFAALLFHHASKKVTVQGG
ncbi:MAG: ABC-2 family transporter protein, partial [Anaeroplasmataceae bacterium]|nr:ABC-2 family transporter protein [Anaeroplasmataceae bacterium]